MTEPYGPLSYEGPPPATGAWREGFPVGRRLFVDVGDVVVRAGSTIPGVRAAYQTWGTLNADASNAVYVCHALTGDSHALPDRAISPMAGGTGSSVLALRSTPMSGSSCASTFSAAARARPARRARPPTADRGAVDSPS